MFKSLFVFLSVFLFGSLCAEELPKDIQSLKEYLDERVWEYEAHKKLLTDSSDIYTYYMVFGKQSAYQEVIIMLDKIIHDHEFDLSD